MQKLELKPWWSEAVMLKDVLSLRELAERYGVTPSALTAAFKRNNIVRTPAPNGPRAARNPAYTALSQGALAKVDKPAVPVETKVETKAWQVTFQATLIMGGASLLEVAEATSKLDPSSIPWKVTQIVQE
jgi:hypothetical protein